MGRERKKWEERESFRKRKKELGREGKKWEEIKRNGKRETAFFWLKC